MSVTLHVGFHKTGTTSIQSWLRDREDDGTLAQHGARFPRGWLRLNNHMELHMALMRPDRMTGARSRGDEWRDPAFRADLLAQVRADLAAHPEAHTILSAEDTSFLHYEDEMAGLRDLVGDATIIVYLRDPAEFLAAWTDQLQKRGTPLSDEQGTFNYVKPDSWLVDYPARVAVWREYFSSVCTVDYHRVMDEDGSVIPSFAALIGVPPLDADGYWLNVRGEFEPRPEGNRFTDGSRFGEDARVRGGADTREG